MLWENETVSPRVGGDTKSCMVKGVAGPVTWIQNVTVPPGTVDLDPGVTKRSQAWADGRIAQIVPKNIITVRNMLWILSRFIKAISFLKRRHRGYKGFR